MKLTFEKLIKLDTCEEGLEWYKEQNTTDVFEILDKLIKQEHLDWANWLLPRMMKYQQYVSYAVYAAEQVIDIFEKEYPNDKRPRLAIEALKKCIKTPTEENKIAAAAAASYAYDAAYAAASYAANAATDAADAAAHAAYVATADAAAAAYVAAYDAANAASYAASYAAEKVKSKIINYGIKLLKEDLCKRKKKKHEGDHLKKKTNG